MHPIHIHKEFELNVIYSMHYGDDKHLFIRKQRGGGTILHDRGCIWRKLTSTYRSRRHECSGSHWSRY